MYSDLTVVNPEGKYRVAVTRKPVGEEWLQILTAAGCRVEYFPSDKNLSKTELKKFIGNECHAVFGQLSEVWDKEMLQTLSQAGGKVLALYAVGYNNTDTEAASELGITVCNTPDALTLATAELGVALTFAAARRIAESDVFMKEGRFTGWKPALMIGRQLHRKTLGVIGLGRIGSAYAEKMIFGNKMNLLYVSPSEKTEFEHKISIFSEFLQNNGEPKITCKKVGLAQLLEQSDVIALFPRLTPENHGLIGKSEFDKMKKKAVFVNMSRGQIVDENALVEHCKRNPDFTCGLDVFEKEPELAPGLKELSNVVLTPHTGSATDESRKNMAVLAARNIIGVLKNYPPKPADIPTEVFWSDNPPEFIPSPVNL